MKIPTAEEAKVFRQWRSLYHLSYSPVAICLLSSIFFAISHHFLYSAGFLISGIVYLPVAIVRHRQFKQSIEAVISKQLR